MKTSTVEKWTWPLLFGGVLLLTVGAASWSADLPTAVLLATSGAVACGIGVLLIYLRSRMTD